MKLKNGELYLGDCLKVMQSLPDHSIDLILCDLPYATTQNKWDCMIDLQSMWKEYWRIAKPNAAIVLTAQTPFDKILGSSQIQFLKYEWIWKKEMGTGHLNAKKAPLKNHENILVFYKKPCRYNPQFTIGKPYKLTSREGSSNYGSQVKVTTDNSGTRYPKSVIEFSRDKEKLHPTQKPVALFEYLVKTYTDEGMVVLDNCAGSGTTAVACENLNRKWICIEMDEGYYNLIQKRINSLI